MTTPTSTKAEIDQALPELPDKYEAAAHMFLGALAEFRRGEKTDTAYSIPVGSPDKGTSVPLWTSDQMRAYATEAIAAERAEVVWRALPASPDSVKNAARIVRDWHKDAKTGVLQELGYLTNGCFANDLGDIADVLESLAATPAGAVPVEPIDLRPEREFLRELIAEVHRDQLPTNRLQNIAARAELRLRKLP